MNKSHEMVRSAYVTGATTKDKKGRTELTISIDDKYQHVFGHKSRVVQALNTASLDQVVAHLNGGDFFMVDGELIEWQYGNQNRFVHDDESIDKLVDVIGITRSSDELEGVSRNTASRSIKLSSEFDRESFDINQFTGGAGDFTTALHFGWSPFSQNVNSSFVLWRLICANGMRGMTRFLNSQIPLINNWEQHLAIANKQLMNKINSKLQNQITSLQNRRASVADCLLVNRHINERATALHNMANDEATARLNAIGSLVNPVLHLSKFYNKEVFEDGVMAKQAPSHITGYDFYNMVTEIRTHTDATGESSGHALDVVANQLLFGAGTDNARYHGHTVGGNLERNLAAQSSPILIANDPDQAFWGN
jgi:hypothetical protein